ncbi:hypothetical protein V1293_001331 [Bradyrhizobium sp. AZCC 1693]
MEPQVEKLSQRKTEGNGLCASAASLPPNPECACFDPPVRISAYSHNRHSWSWNHFGRRPFAIGIHLAEGGRVGLDLAIGITVHLSLSMTVLVDGALVRTARWLCGPRPPRFCSPNRCAFARFYSTRAQLRTRQGRRGGGFSRNDSCRKRHAKTQRAPTQSSPPACVCAPGSVVPSRVSPGPQTAAA